MLAVIAAALVVDARPRGFLDKASGAMATRRTLRQVRSERANAALALSGLRRLADA